MRVFKIVFAFLLLGIFSVSYAQSSSEFSPEQTQAIQKIVHDYLVNNPQVLVEVAQSLEKQQQAKWQKTANTTVPEIAKQLFDDSLNPTVGNPKGDVTLVEFFDFQCPHCKEMSGYVDDLLKKDKNLRVIFKVMPIFGDDSKIDAEVALAAFKQNPEKYMAFHDALMKLQVPLTQQVVLQVAAQEGYNVQQLQADMKNPAYKKEIDKNYAMAKKLNLTGTPAFIMANVVYDSKTKQMLSFKNPVLIPGAVDETTLAKGIEEARGG